MKSIAIVFLLSAAAAWAQEKPQTNDPSTAAGYTTTMPCVATDAEISHQCILRETARLFLLAGQREAALRILCSTQPAQEAYRPGGPLNTAKWQENAEAIRRCLVASGISAKE